MEDRYQLSLKCAWCNEYNYDIDYAESSDCTEFKCDSCGKENHIDQIFKARKKEK